MKILRFFKRTRFFLRINIVGLAIGLAVSIMLILFVVNELSYDRHFKNHERIIRLNTVAEENSTKRIYGICLRKAYTELPDKVTGIEASVQIYKNVDRADIIHKTEQYQNLDLLFADPSFFKVFQMKFVEGTPESAFTDINSIILTHRKAEVIFGSAKKALGSTISIKDKEYIVSAVVEEMPSNTHFTFDILAHMQSLDKLNILTGLEFFTYYLIRKEMPLNEVRESIVREYGELIKPWGSAFNAKAYGLTEKLTDIYLHTEASDSLGKRNSMSFVWLLSALALFILLLAISNFINLFVAQGEVRMNEIGIRKTSGAKIGDFVRQFFSEVSLIILISFVIGLIIAVFMAPFFSKLIGKDIDLTQLYNPWFVLNIIVLFVITVVLSASYPSFYLSRFNPLDILAKRIRFSKRRLTVIIVVFQSVITIVLVSYIWIINRQANYLENVPLGYNPENVMSFKINKNIKDSYNAVKQELLSLPEVKMVGGGNHLIGGRVSGQLISLLDNRDNTFNINEYRVLPGLAEVMEFELIEGESFKDNTADSLWQIMLNEAAVKMLDLTAPVAGKIVDYKGPAEIVGVVKDFYYDQPANKIQPLVLSKPWGDYRFYIKFKDHITRIEGQEAVSVVLKNFDSGFIINPEWAEDLHMRKFEGMKQQAKIVLIASFLSMFIAMLGLVAVHLYATKRRTKEIGIRMINGASFASIFRLLTYSIIKWVIVAGVIAIPIAYYLCSEWMNNFVNRTSLGWALFVIPVIIQCIMALIITSGVSIKALHQNPVETLKSE